MIARNRLFSSSSSSSLNHRSAPPASISPLLADLLAHAFDFLPLHELSRVCAMNREWNRAGVREWNKKLELHLTGSLLEKGFDVLLIKNRCTHLQKLIFTVKQCERRERD